MILLGGGAGLQPRVGFLFAVAELEEGFPQVATAVLGGFGFPFDVAAGAGVEAFGLGGVEGGGGGIRGGGCEVGVGGFGFGGGFVVDGEDGAGGGEDAFDVWAVVGVGLGGARDVDVVGGFGADGGSVGGGGGAEEARMVGSLAA